VPNIILMPFFETVETASKNDASKRGDIAAANKNISSAMLGMDSWIGKGNWKDAGFGDIFLCYRDCMNKYYLRLTGQAERQIQVNRSLLPLRTSENALHVYVTEPRRADKPIPPALIPINRRILNADEYDMVDVNDFLADLSRMQRHRFLLNLHQGLSVPIFLYTWAWGGSGAGTNLHVIWRICLS
jgi:hypothetical protein